MEQFGGKRQVSPEDGFLEAMVAVFALQPATSLARLRPLTLPALRLRLETTQLGEAVAPDLGEGCASHVAGAVSRVECRARHDLSVGKHYAL